jgi:hypothetical protein
VYNTASSWCLGLSMVISAAAGSHKISNGIRHTRLCFVDTSEGRFRVVYAMTEQLAYTFTDRNQ